MKYDFTFIHFTIQACGIFQKVVEPALKWGVTQPLFPFKIR